MLAYSICVVDLLYWWVSL